MTASVLKQDPNTKNSKAKTKKTPIYYDTGTQFTNFRGIPLRQATKRRLVFRHIIFITSHLLNVIVTPTFFQAMD